MDQAGVVFAFLVGIGQFGDGGPGDAFGGDRFWTPCGRAVDGPRGLVPSRFLLNDRVA